MIISLLLILLIYFIVIKFSSETYAVSSYGIITIVRDDIMDEKLNLLMNLLKRMYFLKKYLYNNILKEDKFRPYVEQLYINFTPLRTKIIENYNTDDTTSYSINKGTEIYICLKDKKSNKLHDINLLMYVMIHEMAHLACPTIGHDDLFHYIFNKLINYASIIGIYSYQDYNLNPVQYCGIIIR